MGSGDTQTSGSFDPRSWARGTTPGARPAPDGPPPAGGGAERGSPMLVAGLLSCMLLAGGGIAAWRARVPAAPNGMPVENAATDFPAAPVATRRTLVLSGPDDLLPALVASGIDPAAAAAAVGVAAGGLKPGEIRAAMTLLPDAAGFRLTRLEASNPDSSGVVVTAQPAGGFAASQVAANLTSRVVVRRGAMDADSFYSSAVDAGVTDSLIPEFAKALAFDFDFQREVRKGDNFEAAFEQDIDSRGEAVGPPRLLYAALKTARKAAAVYRFAPPGQPAGWFDENGRSIVRALLRTPVDAARVSSSFGFRVHPVLGFMKLHKGTDFAAPTGTPIFASGDAQIEFAGPKGPNGNFVKLRHDNGWESLYLHMSRFAEGIVTGARVTQGEKIGEVGTTGRSTGPHLHYELHIDGEPVDPVSVKTESGKTLTGAALTGFRQERDRIDISRANLTR